jgi:hypothetical protein
MAPIAALPVASESNVNVPELLTPAEDPVRYIMDVGPRLNVPEFDMELLLPLILNIEAVAVTVPRLLMAELL